MAINYNNSKIYKIVSPTTDKIYIGSTTQILCKRIAKHLSNYRDYIIDNTKSYTTSYEIIKLGDYSIKLIEECNFENKEQLRQREGYYIKLHRDIVVNKVIPCRTPNDYRIDNRENRKQYNIDNKKTIAEKQKQYDLINKDKIAERKKQYNIDNREHIAEVKKQYRIEHKEQAKQYQIDNKERRNELQRQRLQAKINRIWLNELTTL